MTAIKLDAVLEADSMALGKLRFCEVRLMNDARWPWMLLIPQKPDVSELHELTGEELIATALDCAECGQALKQITGCTKINSGALGNVVRQLHIHVLARNKGDPNWPNPVWGFGSPIEYDIAQRNQLVAKLNAKLFEGK